MAALKESWRKLHACDRCRKQKVRCEYRDTESQKCIRCVRTNSECVVAPRGNKKSGDSPSNKPVKNGRTTQSTDFSDIDQASPLNKALNYGIYDVDETTGAYELFTSMGCTIPACETPSSLCELARGYPWTALAIVTSVSLCTSTRKGPERLQMVHSLFTTGMDDKQSISYDTHSALIILCEYLLPYYEKGLIRLNILHGSMCALLQRSGFEFSSQREFSSFSTYPGIKVLARLYECTAAVLMSYSISEVSRTILPTTTLYSQMGDLFIPDNTLYVASIFTDYTQTLELIRNSTCANDVWNICVCGMEKIANAPNPNPKYLACSIVARIQLVTAAMSWSVRSLHADFLDDFLHIVQSACDLAAEFANLFANINVTAYPVPATWGYMASSMATSIWAIRTLSFAVSLDIDIDVNKITGIVISKWKSIFSSTLSGRASFVVVLIMNDLLRFQIGYFNEKDGLVEGRGVMSDFYVYLVLQPGAAPSYQVAVTAKELRDIIRFDSELEGRPICEGGPMEPNTYEGFVDCFSKVVRINIH